MDIDDELAQAGLALVDEEAAGRPQTSSTMELKFNSSMMQEAGHSASHYA